MATVINQQCGSFSDGVFRLLTKPAETHAKKLRKETRVGVHCPVDVYVYDSSHNLCGEIVNNEVNTSYDDLFMYVENDAKYVTFYDDNYYIKLVGNDNGEMNYEIEEIENDSITRKISFENISLGNGKTYTGYIPKTKPRPYLWKMTIRNVPYRPPLSLRNVYSPRPARR